MPRRERRTRPPALLRARLLPAAGRLAVVAGLLLVAAWLAGRAFSDRWPYSQPLAWIPTPLVVLGLWVALPASKLAEILSTRLAGATLRPFALIAALGLTLYLGLGEWHAHRFLTGPFRDRANQDTPALDAVYWNASFAQMPRADEAMLAFDADLTIVAGFRPGQLKRDLHRGLIREARRLADELDPEAAAADALVPDDPIHGDPAARRWLRHVIEIGPTLVLSRDPVRRALFAPFPKLDTAWENERTGEKGIVCLELDTAERLGTDTTVWIVDAHSDPTVHREPLLENAAKTARGWSGPDHTIDPVRLKWAPDEKHDGPTPGEPLGLPEPDLIIGDFNTPRRSRSLRHFAEIELARSAFTGREAFDAAGRGPGYTWLRKLQLWAIDLAFVADDWHVLAAEPRDAGTGAHLALTVSITPK